MTHPYNRITLSNKKEHATTGTNLKSITFSERSQLKSYGNSIHRTLLKAKLNRGRKLISDCERSGGRLQRSTKEQGVGQ